MAVEKGKCQLCGKLDRRNSVLGKFRKTLWIPDFRKYEKRYQHSSQFIAVLLFAITDKKDLHRLTV